MNKYNTLFDKKLIESLVESAKINLERDKFLQPILFIKTSKIDKFIATPFETTSDEHIDKIKYMIKLNVFFNSQPDQYGEILEAILLTDAYYIKTKKNIDLKNIKYPIRENPARLEAITMSGRNIDNTQNVSGIFPYLKIDNKYKFIKKESSLKINKKDFSNFGLLDFLFNPELALKVEDGFYSKNSSLKN